MDQRGNPEIGKYGNKFSSTNQPDPELKKAGWAKKLKGRDLVKYILDADFKGEDPELTKRMANFFNVPTENITNEMMMIFSQVVKAIHKGDSIAFSQVMDRAYGKPKEDITFNNIQDGAQIVIQPAAPIEDIPEIKESEDYEDEDRTAISQD